jgi:hypothetical protein
LARGRVDGSSQCAGANPHSTPRHVDFSNCLQTTEIDDDVAANRAACHPTPGSSRDQRYAALTRPTHELRCIIRIRGNSDTERNRPRDACSF